MKRLSIGFLVVGLLALAGSIAFAAYRWSNIGRYRVTFHDSLMIMVDTSTGQTWVMSARQWKRMPENAPE